jgi:hypothetical protein
MLISKASPTWAKPGLRRRMQRALPSFMSESPKLRRNITPGCLMLIFGALWLLILVTYMIWKLFAQVNEMRTFADTSAKLVSPAQPKEEQIASLRARINAFGVAVGRKEKAELRLTVEDLNTLLAAEDIVRSMRENAKVKSIGETVHVEFSQMINTVPFSDEKLFLNGTLEIAPVMEKDKGLKIRTVNLTVPGKTVTKGFLDLYKENSPPDRFLLDPVRESKDPAISETLKKITNARLEPGAAVLEYAPGP